MWAGPQRERSVPDKYHQIWGTARCAALALLMSGIPLVASEQTLKGHSIVDVSPPDVYALAADWFLGGTVIPSGQSLVLSPGVPNRMGMMWSKYPLLTDNFELAMTFTAKPPGVRNSAGGEGIAVWYVHENVSEPHENMSKTYVDNQESIIANIWPEAMKANGFDLLGYRSKFDGFGVFLCDTGSGPAVGAKSGDGTSSFEIKQGQDLPNAQGFDFQTGSKVTLKLRAKPDGFRVEIEGKSSVEVKSPVKLGGYIGITTVGGHPPKEPKERSNFVELLSLSVINYDTSAQGEMVPKAGPTPAPVPVDKKEDLLAGSSTFKEHRAESSAIKDLTGVVFKLVMETQPLRTQMGHAINSLTKRIEAIETTFNSLSEGLDKTTGHHLTAEFEQIKSELTSLSSVASEETRARQQSLETLHQDITAVHKSSKTPAALDHHLNKLTETNQRTMEHLSSEHQTMFGVSIMAIGFVVVAGLALYNKFRCWEKKHVL